MRKLLNATITSLSFSTALFAIAGSTPSTSMQMHEIMMESCDQMENMPMMGHADHDFAMMMIPHHQSAVDAAKAYLKDQNNLEFKKMAEMIVNSQEKEIKQLKAWLEKN